jgi:hypothetical protein
MCLSGAVRRLCLINTCPTLQVRYFLASYAGQLKRLVRLTKQHPAQRSTPCWANLSVKHIKRGDAGCKACKRSRGRSQMSDLDGVDVLRCSEFVHIRKCATASACCYAMDSIMNAASVQGSCNRHHITYQHIEFHSAADVTSCCISYAATFPAVTKLSVDTVAGAEGALQPCINIHR